MLGHMQLQVKVIAGILEASPRVVNGSQVNIHPGLETSIRKELLELCQMIDIFNVDEYSNFIDENPDIVQEEFDQVKAFYHFQLEESVRALELLEVYGSR